MMVKGQVGQIAFLLGRLMVGGVYLGAGINNLTNLNATAGYAASKGVPDPAVLVTAASALLLIAGLSILTGFLPRAGVAAALLFLVPVSLVMHNFWALQGLQAALEQHSFLANVALGGGALMVLAIPQPWAMSVDRWLSTRRAAARDLEGSRAARATSNAPAES